MSALNEKKTGRIYLFDLDGTLADSMPTAVGIILSFLDERGIAYPDDLIKTLIPLGYEGIAAYYRERFGISLQTEEILGWFIEKLKRAYATEIRLKPTTVETLRALKAQGARLCVLTGSPHAFADACLKNAGVNDLFEFVWSVDDFKRTKADPQIYREAAARLGAAVEALILVDDGVKALKVAKELGVEAVGFYDPLSATLEELKEACDRYVFEMKELLTK